MFADVAAEMAEPEADPSRTATVAAGGGRRGAGAASVPAEPYAGSVAAFETAMKGYRRDPWPWPLLMYRVIRLGVDMAELDSKFAHGVLDALSVPSPAMANEATAATRGAHGPRCDACSGTSVRAYRGRV